MEGLGPLTGILEQGALQGSRMSHRDVCPGTRRVRGAGWLVPRAVSAACHVEQPGELGAENPSSTTWEKLRGGSRCV